MLQKLTRKGLNLESFLQNERLNKFDSLTIRKRNIFHFINTVKRIAACNRCS